MSDYLVAGVELGGTKCIVSLADASGTIISQQALPTTEPETTLGGIGSILEQWSRTHGFKALGIGSFGPVDLDATSSSYGRITATPKPGWRDTDVVGCLSSPFAVPVAFDTDVNAAALAEGRWGAARGLSDYAYTTVGTGVGVGLITNGRPTRGLGHCELGHIRVRRVAGDDWAGSCPYHGDCVEGLAAGSSIKARVGADHISTLAQDDPLWHSVADALAQLCHVMVLATGPRLILMGGGVIEGQPHLLDRIESRLVDSLAGYMTLPRDAPFITSPGLGNQAGPLGPIALALSTLDG
ncbi:MAG: ROK family protein [Sphingobium sp.]